MHLNPDIAALLERLNHPSLPGIDLSLARMVQLLDALGNPERRLPPVIHIAGTNGKGSTLAFLRAIYSAASYRVHAYTSPHLVTFNERIVLAGAMISDDHLQGYLERIGKLAARIDVTFFEATTALAFLAFAEHPADVVLLETGLGGRLDATNLVSQPLCTVITPIDRDHQEFLGDTLAAIAGEKAGIMKRNTSCVAAMQPSEVREVLEPRAHACGAPLLLAGRDWWYQSFLPQDNDCILIPNNSCTNLAVSSSRRRPGSMYKKLLQSKLLARYFIHMNPGLRRDDDGVRCKEMNQNDCQSSTVPLASSPLKGEPDCASNLVGGLITSADSLPHTDSLRSSTPTQGGSWPASLPIPKMPPSMHQPDDAGFSLHIGEQAWALPAPNLLGAHQYANAALAAAVAQTCQAALPVSAAALAQGISQAVWPARLQRLSQGWIVEQWGARGPVLLDGGHNAHAAQAMAQWAKGQRVALICAMMRRKDAVAFFAELAEVVRMVCCVPIVGEPGGYTAEELALAAREAGIQQVAHADDIHAAVTLLAAHPAAPLLIAGSLYQAGEVLKNHS